MGDLFNPNKKVHVYDLLRKRYPASEYALMAEVSDAAGFNRSRSADYIAVSLWPSRGLAINGIELKSFRNDWLNELKNPKKAENIYQYCDRFWLLTANDTIAKLDEIPVTWGWLCIKGSRIVCMKEAPVLKPISVSKDFMCSMLKRAADKTNFVHKDSIAEEVEAARQKGLDDRDFAAKRNIEELNDLKKSLQEFEDASGIKISRYSNSKEMGEAVKYIESIGINNLASILSRQKTAIEKLLKDIDTTLEKIKDEK